MKMKEECEFMFIHPLYDSYHLVNWGDIPWDSLELKTTKIIIKVHSFLRLANYYRRFSKKFSKIT